MTELEFAKKIDELGGTAYLVGGAVRDKFRNVKAHDKDYCICGLDEKIFSENFPKAEKFGKSFPVYSVKIDGKLSEVAFARTERKVGEGYRGFSVNFDKNVTIEEDLFRRDTTINAMAIKILTGEIIDPFGGKKDIEQKKIRAVSEHFTEDPVRALRAARQSAQFNFEITSETLTAMNFCAEELSKEPGERIFAELENALKTDKPSIFFRSLDKANLLKIIFPEIYQLKGKIQPVFFHPEGDAYEHSLKILDEVSSVNKKTVVRFAALVHDIGKGITPTDMLPHHYQHERRGLKVFEKMTKKIPLPNDWKKTAEFVISEHMRAPVLAKPGKIVELLLKIHKSKISVEDFNDIIRADHNGLPNYLERAEFFITEMLKVSGKNAPPELKGTEIGNWIFQEQIKIFNMKKICKK
ncbi:MAG: HD domain-containing protein [Selenomonadaceae bacterium]|nr:HD domain-containing protein [Selenomonadaceae bacterium]